MSVRRSASVPFAAGLLGRHVGRRAQNLPFDGHRDLARLALRQAEVHDVRLAAAVDHDVAGLQVAMDHALLVGVVQGLGDAAQQSAAASRSSGRLSRAQRSSVSPR